MAFQAVPNKVDFPAQEREILRFWQETRAFEKLVELHRNDPSWSFIDGPITANNPMGVHHGWGRFYKDLFQRFWTMRGRRLRYQNGFDCQGLWVEVEVEKEKGFTSKKDIEAYGLESFVRQCKARVLRYAAIQTEQSIRLGYWMDWNSPDELRWLADRLLEDPNQVITIPGPLGPVTGTVEQVVGRLGMPDLEGSYFTFSNENNFMIWTFLKRCWEKGWLYRGVDVMPWCPRCATGISQHEIVTDGYAELTHPSVTVRFPLKLTAIRSQPSAINFQQSGREQARDNHQEFLLVWTTTPWTLTSNVAVAVGSNLTYVQVLQGNEIYYLSKGTLHMLHGPYQVLGELKGAEMTDWTYTGPFDDLPAAQEPGGLTPLPELTRGVTQSAAEAHQVILWEQVGETEGTGIVHIAPGCGEEDFQLGQQYNLPMLAPLDDEGHFVEGLGWLTGQHVAQSTESIFADLQRKGLLYHVEDYTHRYPTCWRCHTELVFRLVDEWFISMGEVYRKPREQLSAEEKARSLRYQIMDVVDQIQWIPEFGHAREMDWLRNMHDWMISKKRYWGLALPIWVCQNCGKFEVIGDEIELKGRAVSGWEVFAGHTPHRPHMDAVKLECPDCHAEMSRVLEVGNPWLDAGIVPFSTLSYRSNRDYWRAWYPAHWISESFPGQFRNWFYSLLAMATVLDQSPPFIQNFGYATCLAEDGREMHKSWGNMIEFNEAADQMGVDVMRWLFATHISETDLLFGYKRGDEVRRQFLIPLWNIYSFFVTYANLDGWQPSPLREGAHPGAPLPGTDHTGTPMCVPTHGRGTSMYALNPEDPTPPSANLLDRWILARLNQTVARVTEALEHSNPPDAAAPVEAFLDDLSNWYVRRSRRRFWKSDLDADKQFAYTTLYHVLVKLIRLLAPFTPFVSEVIYQNLVCSLGAARGDCPPSVHHTAWPQADLAAVDENLLDQMALARQIASLGLAARKESNLKVRQPLARVLVYTTAQGQGAPALSPELVEIITNELNVKALEFVQEASRLVTYRIQPDNKLLGPRFGARFPQVRQALAATDPAQIAARVQSGLPVTLQVGSEEIELAASEILVQTQPAAGLAVAADKGLTVAIDTVVTPELRAEGLARELVRQVQAMRKEAGFEIADRIALYYQAEPSLSQVIRDWQSYIGSETLAVALINRTPPEDAYVEQKNLEGEAVTLGVARIEPLKK